MKQLSRRPKDYCFSALFLLSHDHLTLHAKFSSLWEEEQGTSSFWFLLKSLQANRSLMCAHVAAT